MLKRSVSKKRVKNRRISSPKELPDHLKTGNYVLKCLEITFLVIPDFRGDWRRLLLPSPGPADVAYPPNFLALQLANDASF
jgi:hypothetical protein